MGDGEPELVMPPVKYAGPAASQLATPASLGGELRFWLAFQGGGTEPRTSLPEAAAPPLGRATVATVAELPPSTPS